MAKLSNRTSLRVASGVKKWQTFTAMASDVLDPLVFGQRLRHYRRQAGLTLEALGEAVGRPPSYLSQVENGHREPRLSMVNQLAAALGCRSVDLLDAAAPSRR